MKAPSAPSKPASPPLPEFQFCIHQRPKMFLWMHSEWVLPAARHGSEVFIVVVTESIPETGVSGGAPGTSSTMTPLAFFLECQGWRLQASRSAWLRCS